MNNLYDEPRELVTGMPEHIIVGVIRALETAGAAMEVSDLLYFGCPFLLGAAVLHRRIAARYRIGAAAGVAESPIEEMLGGALTAELRRRYPPEKFGIFNPAEPNEHIAGCIMLVAQFDLLRFRYDFALRIQGFPRPFLLIECDSKQFHSSPEQVENDRRKDECAFRHGIPIMRFTGGEIHYRIDKCVSEVIKFIEEMK